MTTQSFSIQITIAAAGIRAHSADAPAAMVYQHAAAAVEALGDAGQLAGGCPNPWHGTAPSRARQTCPECPPEQTAAYAGEPGMVAYRRRARSAERQFCRTGIHDCTPAVTLTFDGGSRRLHWCEDHKGDAVAYLTGDQGVMPIPDAERKTREDAEPPVAGAFLRPEEADRNACTCWATSRNGCPVHYVR